MFLSLVHRDVVDEFEEKFGDLHDSHLSVWGRISEGIASKLSRIVVSVATFKDEYIRVFFTYSFPYFF
jgi:hypothetical protein